MLKKKIISLIVKILKFYQINLIKAQALYINKLIGVVNI